MPRVAVSGAGVVQLADYAPGSTYGPRELLEHEFVWLVDGSATWTASPGPRSAAAPLGPAGGTTLALAPGTLLLAPAGAVDYYQWDHRRPSRHAWAHFSVEDPGELPDPAGWPLTRDMTTAPVLQAVCGYLLELAGQQSTAARRRSDQLLGLLLDLVVRGPLEEPEAVLPPLVTAALDAVRRSWRSGGMRLVGAEEIAGAAGVSVGHLFRVFRQQYGCGPARALELVRLARAAVLLQRSNASLAEVAATCGFANAYHLSRRFRAAYEVPPGAYRRSSASQDALGPVRAAGLLPVAHLLAEP